MMTSAHSNGFYVYESTKFGIFDAEAAKIKLNGDVFIAIEDKKQIEERTGQLVLREITFRQLIHVKVADPEHNPLTATGEYLDKWANVMDAKMRQPVRFKGLKFIQYFLFPLKGNAFELPPPRGHRWETDAELRERVVKGMRS